jgi:hypothetical protein
MIWGGGSERSRSLVNQLLYSLTNLLGSSTALTSFSVVSSLPPGVDMFGEERLTRTGDL